MPSPVRRTLAVLAVTVVCPASAVSERTTRSTHEAAAARVASDGTRLIVTFSDRPTASDVAQRLDGLGQAEPVLAPMGIWDLRISGDSAATRRAVLRREGVARAEWSLERTTDVLSDPRPVPPPPLPVLTLPEPTDPLYAQPSANQQWGLRLGTWLPGLAGYERPIIAILDSGVDPTHEEWRDGALVAPYSTLRNVGSADDAARTGHGTHVAGIAAAPANGVGVVGVAPASPSAPVPGVSKVIPVQIANVDGISSDLTMMRGIVWAVNNGAKVINISSGGPGYQQAFQDVVNWAYKRGAVIVASVGNEGFEDNPVNFPAGYDHVIGVAAQCDGIVVPGDCPQPFQRARFSNFNYSVDVLAPGVNMPSTVPLRVTDRQITPGYAFKDGTSMAAPYVAGVIALIQAANPGITPHQVTRILQSTSSRGGVSRTSTDGWGAINPLAAVQAQAPADDLSEPNDDVKWLRQLDNIRVKKTVTRLVARADFNDDQLDVYPIILRKGERARITIASQARARFELAVFRPSTSVSPRLRSRAELAAKELGAPRFTTPGARSVVIRAKESGRHYVRVIAALGGGAYSVSMARL